MRRLTWVAMIFFAPLSMISGAAIADEDAELAQAKSDTANKLKEIGIAMHNHHDAFKRFPPPAMLGGDGKPLLSWRVKILQFVDKDLYDQFHLDEPWDSAHNKTLLPKMPAVYRCSRSKAGDRHRTIFQVPRGDSTIFPGPEGPNLRTITDGTSLTIMIVEAAEEHAVPWTKPEDWTFDPEKPGAGLAGHFPGVFFVSAADASVHQLPLTIETDTLRALFTRNGRERVAFP